MELAWIFNFGIFEIPEKLAFQKLQLNCIWQIFSGQLFYIPELVWVKDLQKVNFQANLKIRRILLNYSGYEFFFYSIHNHWREIWNIGIEIKMKNLFQLLEIKKKIESRGISHKIIKGSSDKNILEKFSNHTFFIFRYPKFLDSCAFWRKFLVSCIQTILFWKWEKKNKSGNFEPKSRLRGERNKIHS